VTASPADGSVDDLARLGQVLRTRSFGRAHEHHPRIDSTNARAGAWAEAGAPHGAVVTADAQLAGRGRRGRSWASPPGLHLFASVVVRPPRTGPTFGALGLAVAVALRDALPAVSRDVRIKWPNDLLVAGRKLAGILCEARWQGSTPELVVGFGINVKRWTPPAELEDVATTLEAQGAEVLGRATILAGLLGSLEDTLDAFFADGFAAVRERYARWCSVVGHDIELAGPDDVRRRVRAEALDDDGALLVRTTPGGPLERVEAADVWLSPLDL
jgi:BirA family biotin operon repressor/biotin-[acetyl-CoA-carboxylase] ligase